ncbi:DUF3278 domain-containing protein [Limosilactobacillus albertensis]|uniref:DUF3278 domain-containing protein n=1 Tax=Limosilactobacillus albertensis TaxID=2759752 RepID=A0A839GZM6_9LACO|nr:DUF3278 domain-containing protein [Limosilactobacillus albertensis]MBB1122884.1 DUF3278 domain-containing protein [Limosilactobacillus albertensis]MCD7121128.1 DUF3278 domain-containing protein [Limosilactobacillus albertensis]
MIKEKLRTKLLKLSYGISGSIDEYQERELDRLGNSGYLLLTLLAPFILFVSVIVVFIAGYKAAFWFAVCSLFTLFIVVTWYFYIVAIRQKVLMNEVGSGEVNQKRKIAIKRGIITGIFFTLIEFIAQVIIYQSYAIKWNFTAGLIVIFGSVLLGIFAGLLSAGITWKNIKKIN